MLDDLLQLRDPADTDEQFGPDQVLAQQDRERGPAVDDARLVAELFQKRVRLLERAGRAKVDRDQCARSGWSAR